ncbi:VCBS repeat-containing protein [Streptomyces sp. NBC_01278]|uniref:FG-GAP repeat domain-containing protein n=1 Tax=Streptomyces sp. NBC_01278 TaxID=2903809 RepID=UPI002E351AE7|nr:VCBS repeat-containing protein [Streptomyces sp. NBC_01278]
MDAWMPAATDNGKAAPPGYWKDPATGKPALIGHSNDWFPGDGVTDLIARTPDGKLYVYQSDGNGRFDISRRMEILLPAGAPDPATLTRLAATPDANGDGSEDIFATAGDAFWTFTGYSGASITEAERMSATGWTERDIVGVWDVSGDKVPTSSSATATPPTAASPCARASLARTAARTSAPSPPRAPPTEPRTTPTAPAAGTRPPGPSSTAPPDVNGDGIPTCT